MTTAINPTDALRALNQETLNGLLEARDQPCVSMYLPMDRMGSDTRKNALRFRNALEKAEIELRGKHPEAADRLIAALDSLMTGDETDHPFWQHQLSALAVFHSGAETMLIRLPRPTEEHVAVADSFHIKPLIRVMQSPGRYQLLAISQKNVTLYEGDRDNLDVVPIHPDVPRSLTDALGDEVDGQLNVNSYGGMGYSGMFHGHHDNKDDRDVDLERFFRVIDKAIYDYHGRGGDLPIYLAADVDYHDRFQKVSHHPRLQEKGVRINPDAVEVTPDRLREEMNQLILPHMEQQTVELLEQLGNATSAGKGSNDLNEVAMAAAGGRVQILILDAGKHVGGRVDPVTGELRLGDESDPDLDDVLDDLAELTLQKGGQVRVVESEKHPSNSGVAAIFRY